MKKTYTKKNILFLLPLLNDPDAPNTKDRFEMLSSKFEGYVFSLSPDSRKYGNLSFGDFKYHPVQYQKGKIKRYYHLYCKVLEQAAILDKKKNFDLIYAYDPLVLGVLAVFLKLRFGSKAVIEINGHLKKDGFYDKKGVKTLIKRSMIKMVANLSLLFADHIKLLNNEQIQEWRILKHKDVHMFHDFVPSHMLDKKSSFENYILFMGYPFKRKGVDILIKAYLKACSKCSDIKLKIYGHCPDGDAERQYYKDMAKDNPNIEINMPVDYNTAIDIIQGCRFLVLPSRSEGMGRVLLEAMSAGKAVIGSNVGGIKHIIQNGYNGYLFENENIDQLEKAIETLCADDHLCKKMGERSLEIIEAKYSSKKYLEAFVSMIDKIL